MNKNEELKRLMIESRNIAQQAGNVPMEKINTQLSSMMHALEDIPVEYLDACYKHAWKSTAEIPKPKHVLNGWNKEVKFAYFKKLDEKKKLNQHNERTARRMESSTDRHISMVDFGSSEFYRCNDCSQVGLIGSIKAARCIELKTIDDTITEQNSMLTHIAYIESYFCLAKSLDAGLIEHETGTHKLGFEIDQKVAYNHMAKREPEIYEKVVNMARDDESPYNLVLLEG